MPLATHRPARPRRATAVVLVAALAASCAGAAPDGGQGAGSTIGAAQAGGQVGTPVTLTLERPDGTSLAIGSLMGRAVLLVGVLMDDLGSQATARNAEQLAREHPEDLAVVVIVGDRHPYSRLRQMAQVYRGVLELRRSDLVLADDEVREGRSPLGLIEHVPAVYLVNRAGRIARRVEGYLSPAQLAALVAPALPPRVARPPAAGPPVDPAQPAPGAAPAAAAAP